jgi:hypothetical protein
MFRRLVGLGNSHSFAGDAVRIDWESFVKRVMAALLIFASVSRAQTNAGPTEPVKPSTENVYSEAWEVGEVKECSTWAHVRSLLMCNGKSFAELIGDKAPSGMSEKDAYEEAFQFALVHSKMFVVKFSKNPWPASKPPQGSRDTIDLIRRRPNDMTL